MSRERTILKRGAKVEYNQEILAEYLKKIAHGLDSTFVKTSELADKITAGICDNMTTEELSVLAAETAANMTTNHPHYSLLAGRIEASLLHRTTPEKFSDSMLLLAENPIKTERSESSSENSSAKEENVNMKAEIISDDIIEIVMKNRERLDSAIKNERDFDFSYFGIKTLKRSYLLKSKENVIVERPQYLWMRVSLGIHRDDIDAVIETYELMSTKHFIHATPTLFNSSTIAPQLSSCFLLSMQSDSIEGIYNTLKQCALISKHAGGIGVNIQNVRGTGTYIKGTFGHSNGIVPMLRVFDATSKYVDQGGNKRPGSIVVYLEPWHTDVFDFLDLKKNTGKEEMRARNLFLGLWIPDLFMHRVENDEEWSLFCPNTAKDLHEVYGEAFDALYTQYEQDKSISRKTVPARKLWKAILEAEIETGVPYILYKDACNKKSNQSNLGTIKGSNLCAEIVEYTSPDEVAVCNLASLALPTYIVDGQFDFQKLKKVAGIVTKNLNKIIDVNKYPLKEARDSNLKNRPIGIGVQGLADVYILMGYPFESEQARNLNRDIFETIYYGALEASCEISEALGPYCSYAGSPVSKGILQYDMWNVVPTDRWDWAALKKRIAQHGVRNSLLVALMPTASTSQILGYNECFEGFTSNIYTRRTLSGEFQIVNSHLVRDLADLGLWGQEMKNIIIEHEGSVQNIPSIPDHIKSLYKTVWEIKQKAVIDQAADRGAFVDQSQSMNIHIATPTFAQLTSMHFYGWKKGLKTGTYYLRTKPSQAAIKFTVDKQQAQEFLQKQEEEKGRSEGCPIDGDCLSCGS
ncbi:ribonucleoside-diphosphate reductase subunit M1 [Nematocida minor]|uniref:ribonucleoside-diphosphate reductase subunit M1 n=1 Tax=Nematocida minor TaxID=1912983 RepID=UPI00221F1304|nr:ribonucleoside-diphosphate reductase subunit M1 [Nematocida minor]KAI5191993.1 ribonucleoside-diphosphate reductase subunit M1 [Nematocida minor]